MTPNKRPGEELETDITFIKTPPQPPAKFATGESCGVTTTNVSESWYGRGPVPLATEVLAMLLLGLGPNRHQLIEMLQI